MVTLLSIIIIALPILFLAKGVFFIALDDANKKLEESRESLERMQTLHDDQIRQHVYGTLSVSEVMYPPKTQKIESPREREQWWIDNWLDMWKRQVGSVYVPLKGDADYVAPSKVMEDQIVKATKIPSNTSWQVEQFGKVLTRNEIIGSREPIRMGAYENNERSIEHRRLRKQIDPHGFLDDFQYERVKTALVNTGYVKDGLYTRGRREAWEAMRLQLTTPIDSSGDIRKETRKYY